MSDDLEKSLENFKKIDKIQSEWLTSLNKANEVAPEVKKANEVIKWQIRTLSSRPPDTSITSNPNLLQMSSSALGLWEENLGQIPTSGYEAISSSASAATGTAGTITFEMVSNTSVIDDPPTRVWVQTYRNEYIEIQEKQNRVEDVRTELEELSPGLAIEFDEAVNTYHSAKAGIRPHRDAVNTMRNVLDHTKGELFNKTGDRRTLSKKRKWEIIGDKLAIGGPGGVQRGLLLNEVIGDGSNWERLWRRLGDVIHGLVTTETDLTIIFTNWIDLLYRVFILIDSKHY